MLKKPRETIMPPPNRPPPRALTVLKTQKVTRNMLRLTLGGEGLDGFPEGQQGGYVKFNFPPEEGRTKPVIRTYTIRDQRDGELDVDFALHGSGGADSGPATAWAMSAQIGDEIKLGGPGASKPLPAGAGSYLLVGDMTALPAISVNLEALDASAKGVAIIEIMHEDDAQDIAHPSGVELIWLVNPLPGEAGKALGGEVRSLELAAENLYAWVACEFSGMRELRAFLQGDLGLGRDQLYISSYWKCGATEERHKEIKRDDASQIAQ